MTVKVLAAKTDHLILIPGPYGKRKPTCIGFPLVQQTHENKIPNL